MFTKLSSSPDPRNAAFPWWVLDSCHVALQPEPDKQRADSIAFCSASSVPCLSKIATSNAFAAPSRESGSRWAVGVERHLRARVPEHLRDDRHQGALPL